MRFPIELAVASPASVVPGPGESWVYEPKYDGWRGCLHAGAGRLHSRSGTDLSARFPELLAAASELALDQAVLDGELVAVRGDAARLEFAALQASPRRRRVERVVVYFLVFDLLASQHGEDLRSLPYAQRRDALQALLSGAQSPLQPVPATTDREAALDWLDPAYGTVGIEGVVAKPSGPYRRGRASGWRKTRHTVTTEAIVAGVSTGASGQHALVLALPTATGRWHAVGLSQPLSGPAHHELAGKLDYLGLTARLPGIVAGLPGHEQVDYVPVAPSVVVEIETDAVGEHGRLRHRPRYVRTRPDRRPGDLPQAPETGPAFGEPASR